MMFGSKFNLDRHTKRRHKDEDKSFDREHKVKETPVPVYPSTSSQSKFFEVIFLLKKFFFNIVIFNA